MSRGSKHTWALSTASVQAGELRIPGKVKREPSCCNKTSRASMLPTRKYSLPTALLHLITKIFALWLWDIDPTHSLHSGPLLYSHMYTKPFHLKVKLIIIYRSVADLQMQLSLQNNAGQEPLVFVLFKLPVKNKRAEEMAWKKHYLKHMQRHIAVYRPYLKCLRLSKAVIKVNRLMTRLT